MSIDLQDTLAARKQAQSRAQGSVDLAKIFYSTSDFRLLRQQVFNVLAEREHKMKEGLTEHQTGVAIIAASGMGKSRMLEQVLREHHAVSEALNDFQFGYRILNVLVPGNATIKETCEEILSALNYPNERVRDEAYLVRRVRNLLAKERIAGLWLDEVQDVGRHATPKVILAFTKRFRNLMQDSQWPVCLFLSATPEAREIFKMDKTLSRRLIPLEIVPMTVHNDAALIRSTAADLLSCAEINEPGFFAEDEFIEMLIKAADGRWGIFLKFTIDAIIRARNLGRSEINLDDYAHAFYKHTNNQDELNPFISPHWRSIDTATILDRVAEETKQDRRRDASKSKKKKSS